MTLSDYCKTQFFLDIRKLKTEPIQKINAFPPNHNNAGEAMFGGSEWRDYTSEIQNIPQENLKFFLRALFLSLLTTANAFTHFRDFYDRRINHASVLHFGWQGFGQIHENIKWLLNRPEQEGVVFSDNDLKEMVCFYFKQCKSDTASNGLDYKAFMSAIKNDRGFCEDKMNSAFSRFVHIFNDSYEREFNA